MNKCIWIAAALVLALAPAFGQSGGASKFDEITNILSYDDPEIERRVERFANYVKKNGHGKQVFIVRYGARILNHDKRNRLGSWVNSAKWRLMHSPVAQDDIFVIDGGLRELDTFELWIAPKGSPAPTPAPKYAPHEAIDCPSIHVFQSGLNFERTVHFEVSIRPEGNYSYEWSVDKGKIESRGNNDVIKVDLDEQAGNRVTAFLKVSGLPVPCKNTFIAVGEAGNTPKLLDEFGHIPSGDFKSRMDSFYIVLANYPQMQGYVYFYGDRKLSSQDVRNNRNRLLSYSRMRRFDMTRITIVEAGFNENQTTQFWLVPPGVSPPKPSPSVDQRFVTRSRS